MPVIHFFQEELNFSLSNEKATMQWIETIVENEAFTTSELNFIFCSDEYLYRINKMYLDHDTYTDIITFDNSEVPGQLEGDIFISIDRVKDNAGQLKVDMEDELARVMIHGVLHLMGYKDKTPQEQLVMRKKEEACLSLR